MIEPHSSKTHINLKPSFWGNYAWSFLYSVAMGYPSIASDDEKQAAVNMIRSLVYLLPCGSCRTNFKSELERDPPETHVGSSDELMSYINTLNNVVSKRLNKPEKTVSEIRERLFLKYEMSLNQNATPDMESVSSSSSSHYLHLIWIVLLVATCASLITWLVTHSVGLKKQHKLRRP